MSKIEVTKQNVEAAFEIADEKTKKVLIALFGPVQPDFSDWRNIKSYHDACIVNGEAERNFEGLEPDEVAFIKLKSISKALWGKDFQPQPDGEGSKTYYYAWPVLYTKSEISSMSIEKKRALLSAFADFGTYAGFGYSAYG